MIKAVLDANLYVSALLKRPDSNPVKIIQMVYEREIRLLISDKILSEVRRVLLYPRLKKLHCCSTKQIDQFLKKLARIAEITPGQLIIKAIKDDPTDNKYLECAVEGRADFIISGDHHLTDLKTFQGIKITNPSTFINYIKHN